MSSPRRSRRRRAERRQLIIGKAEAVTALAAGFTCPDCHSNHGRTWVDEDGITHVTVEHDDGCPYLRGVTR